MLRPPAAGYICPCCGVEFEVDDDELSHDELRRLWIARGRPWFSDATPPPPNWNALAQLMRAGYIHEVYALTGGYTQTESVHLGATVRSSTRSTSHNQLTRAVAAGSRVAGIATTAGA
jgi:hypothetical protein